MSKVYEALRQKEHETSSDLESFIATEPEISDESPKATHHDFEITDRVLRAALAAAEEEQQGPQHFSKQLLCMVRGGPHLALQLCDEIVFA